MFYFHYCCGHTFLLLSHCSVRPCFSCAFYIVTHRHSMVWVWVSVFECVATCHLQHTHECWPISQHAIFSFLNALRVSKNRNKRIEQKNNVWTNKKNEKKTRSTFIHATWAIHSHSHFTQQHSSQLPIWQTANSLIYCIPLCRLPILAQLQPMILWREIPYTDFYFHRHLNRIWNWSFRFNCHWAHCASKGNWKSLRVWDWKIWNSLKHRTAINNFWFAWTKFLGFKST